MLLTAGCGSSEYNAKIDATAAELRRGTPAAPAAAVDGQEAGDAASAAPNPQPKRDIEKEKVGGGGTGVGNAIGLAPM